MMGKIKDRIIKALGGHTAEDWDRFMGVRLPVPKPITTLDLATIVAQLKFTPEEWDCLGPARCEDLVKNRLLCGMSSQLGPFVEITVTEPKPPHFSFDVVARVRVLRPENGGVFRYEHDREEATP